MKFLTLYLVFLKATSTPLAGLASLPIIREELVIDRQMLTDQQLNAAIVITRSTPGPAGVYVVSIGYFADGVLGAMAGWLAMATPALAILLLLRFIGPLAEHPRVKGMLQAVVLASAGLLLSSTLPLARDAIVGPLTLSIALIALVLLFASKKVDALWVLAAGAAVSLLGATEILDFPQLAGELESFGKSRSTP
ncbi:chromate transporter [Pendulispora albinea]|uniref:Chromate transporter n=1 Tax=Pendulispora albinea TaxID=2741071 RepID=A0ABZ2LWD0_9BACT